jgi:hypothetical protein
LYVNGAAVTVTLAAIVSDTVRVYEPAAGATAVNAYVAVVGLVTAKVPVKPGNDAVAVELKPVPVKVMTVPTAAPAARLAGAAEVITGPATVKAVADCALLAVVLKTSIVSAPAVAPVPTFTAAEIDVPAAFTVGVNVTCVSWVPAAVNASMVLPEPKPVPVMVNVTGVVPVEPTTIGALGLTDVAVTVGATVEA